MAAGDRLVHAAGGVVWRPAGAAVVIAVVHRPRYDDWSLPKGKRHPGEHLVATARREVAEETGELTTVGRPLGSSRYPVLVKGRRTPKEVAWWAMESRGRQPGEGSEVDEVRWVSPQHATGLLTYRHEVDVVRRFTAGPPRPAVVLLVRHARTGSRRRARDDDQRTLDSTGEAQARALADVLLAFGPTRVVSAPSSRCVQTVLPLAARLDLPVRLDPRLGDRAVRSPVTTSADVVRRQALAPASVLCGHGAFIRHAVATLHDVQADRERLLAGKGSTWVLALHEGHVLSAAYLPRPG